MLPLLAPKHHPNFNYLSFLISSDSLTRSFIYYLGMWDSRIGWRFDDVAYNDNLWQLSGKARSRQRRRDLALSFDSMLVYQPQGRIYRLWLVLRALPDLDRSPALISNPTGPSRAASPGVWVDSRSVCTVREVDSRRSSPLQDKFCQWRWGHILDSMHFFRSELTQRSWSSRATHLGSPLPILS